MQQILINIETGGFGISKKAVDKLVELGYQLTENDIEYIKCVKDSEHDEWWDNYYLDIKRDDPLLIQAFKEIGNDMNTAFSRLVIVDIPDGVEWEIESYECGYEWVAEKHRRWFGDEES